jgi:uncharacterized membrane protein YeiH
MRALWLRWRSDPLRWTLWLIAAGTFLSGVLLIVLQELVLDLLSAPTTTSDRLFFAIIGMFMAIVGGTLAQDLLGQPHRFVVGWSALQKTCASAAMSVAVALSVFSYYGIILAAFDFCSALLAIAFWWRLSS